MVETVLTPPHPDPFEALLDEPFASTLYHPAAQRQPQLFVIGIVDMGFWGTTEQETGVSAACWVANVLLSARDRRIWRNGHLFVCNSPLQKPKLVRQLLQSQIANLLNCMHLCLNRVFCSVVL
jgi:hypothetical protein